MTAAPLEQCSKGKALKLTRELKQSLEISWNLLREAFEVQAWAALGYDSWDAYCAAELNTDRFRLSRELRQQVVAELTRGDKPMSNRAIAPALGVSESTVRADRAAGARNRAPAYQLEVVDAEVVVESEADKEHVEDAQPPGTVRRVTGMDGKSYPTKPEIKRRRRSLADRFGEDAVRLGSCADRLVEFTEDDRFGIDRADLNERHRRRLKVTAEAIAAVLEALGAEQ